jgi:hypothetical protein
MTNTKSEIGTRATGGFSAPLAPPPGLSLPMAPTSSLPESLSVVHKAVNGAQVCRVEWRIDNVKTKFKDCVGRPLVSPQFEAAQGHADAEIRGVLMVFPSLGDLNGLTMREQKSKYEQRIAESLSGSLKFKVVAPFGDKLVIGFKLFVGSVLQGPYEHNFADHIIYGSEFENNWLDEINKKNGSLVVGVEMLTVQGGVKGAPINAVPPNPGPPPGLPEPAQS